MWALAASATAALVVRITGRLRGHCRCTPQLDLLAGTSVLHIAAVICVLCFLVVEETRYLLPLVVPLAILQMWTLAQFPDWSLASAWCVLLGGQWVCVFLQAFGGIAPQPTMTHWLIPLNTDSRRSDELTRLVKSTSKPEIQGRINVIGVEYPWLNANSASFYAAKAALSGTPRCYFTSLGYAETDVEAAWTRLLESIKPPYFISVGEDHRPPSDAFNAVSLPILERVGTDPSFTRELFDSDFGITVFRRMPGASSP